MSVLSLGAAIEFELDFESGTETAWLSLRVVPKFSAAGQVAGALVIGTDISVHKSGWSRRCVRLQTGAQPISERSSAGSSANCTMNSAQRPVALRMNVNLFHIRFGGGELQIREATDRMLALVDMLIESIRDVSASLRPTMLDMELVPALGWLTSRFARHTDMQCNLRVVHGEVEITEERAVTLFRIVQESLTNAARHSKARRIDVAFRSEADAFVVEVGDHGVGFDAQYIRKPNAFGLVGIRERALAAGAESVVVSKPRRGTVVRARIPISDAARSSMEPNRQSNSF